MREFILLDAGPLGHACRRPGTPLGDQCRLWLDGLVARGVIIVIPEIADYEVRRELTRINASSSLSRLDDLVTAGGLSYFARNDLGMASSCALSTDTCSARRFVHRMTGIRIPHRPSVEHDWKWRLSRSWSEESSI